MIFVLGLSSCAHKSKVQPSKGHIDGQNTAANPKVAKSESDKASSTAAIPKPVTNNTYLPPHKPKTK
jgi:general secretion pathway protein D